MFVFRIVFHDISGSKRKLSVLRITILFVKALLVDQYADVFDSFGWAQYRINPVEFSYKRRIFLERKISIKFVIHSIHVRNRAWPCIHQFSADSFVNEREKVAS